MAKKKPAWRNRLVGSGEQPASAFKANPANWRTHPETQQDALEGVLRDVGWVQNVIINRRTGGRLVDGHQRIISALKQGDDTPVPYIEIDVDEAEEALILATLDPLAAMAGTDTAALDALLRSVQTGEAGVQAMLAKLAEDEGIVAPVAPDDFPVKDEHLDVEHTCPKCGYQWSGGE